MDDDSSGRLVAALREWLGSAPPGARLPSTRQLVADHAVSPVTVQKALRALSAAGLVETRPGVGTFARASRPTRPVDFGWQTTALGRPRTVLPAAANGALRVAPPGAQELHSGYPEPGLLPERLVRTALVRAARSGAATSRAHPSGVHDLRRWFAEEVSGQTALGQSPPTANDVIVVPGSQSGLTSIFRALVAPGQPLLMESPTYWGAILAAHQAGVRPVPIGGDREGPLPDQLERVLRETGARAFYAQPTFANPTGVRWSAERAHAVLELARRYDAFVVEDDWAHDFAIDGDVHPLVAQDDSGHVVYIRSLTKSMSPAVRVGAVIARGPALERLRAERSAQSLYVSTVLQQAALEVVTDPGWRAHLRRLRTQLRERRDLLVRSLRERAPGLVVGHVPGGGLHLWGRLPAGTPVDRVVRECEQRGVWVAAGTEWFPTEAAAPYVRLTFSGPDPAGFPEAAGEIQAALDAEA